MCRKVSKTDDDWSADGASVFDRVKRTTLRVPDLAADDEGDEKVQPHHQHRPIPLPLPRSKHGGSSSCRLPHIVQSRALGGHPWQPLTRSMRNQVNPEA
jgi:hypothetical protein